MSPTTAQHWFVVITAIVSVYAAIAMVVLLARSIVTTERERLRELNAKLHPDPHQGPDGRWVRTRPPDPTTHKE